MRYNIQQGWAKVKDKLAQQAAAGWHGSYAPWKKAQGYLYCISARFTSADEKIELQKNIRDFFDGLLSNQRPPFKREQIHVWDWNDLAHWFRESGRLADDWLGIGFDELEHHGAYRARISASDSGFHAYLLTEKLPFIAPDLHDPFHPDNLFARLVNGENLSLVGEGGVGKTRTVFEVAEYAHREGWRVLHLRPSDAGIDLKRLAEELLRHSGHTLVTADYIDQFRDFDERYWTHTLLPEAKKRGVQLALLANARPLAASLVLKHLAEKKLLAIVDMKPSPVQREKVTRQIESVICPRALQILSEEKVRELCGPRPIIAMFIARELERLAEVNNLTHDALPRPGDLSGWILKRLREDQLLPDLPASAWELPSTPPVLCAAAAISAASPMSEGELINVAQATLQVLASPLSAPHIVATLRRGGWLEQEGYSLRTPHDAVADEILRSTLTQYPDSLPVLLAGARQGRSLGRFAVSLGRLGEEYAPLLSNAAQWLQREATDLSQGLLGAEPDTAAYALGAVFDCPPLAVAALQAWPQLVTPWLVNHASHPSARHLLYRGLKNLPEQEAHRLRDVAFDWLNSYPLVLEADFVLGPLLAWSSSVLDGREAELCKLALEWLRDHPTALEAGYVLHPLLGWKQERLSDAEGKALLNLALEWLRVHPTALEAQFVLHPLLGWKQERLNDAEGNALLNLALEWLRDHPTALEAGYVLPPLLGWKQEGLSDAEGKALLNLALEWLRDHPTALDAGFLLNPLLGWKQERLHKTEGELLKLAMNWLDQFGNTPDAGFILNELLLKSALKPDERSKWSQRALELARELQQAQGDVTHLLKTLLQLAGRHTNEVPAHLIVIFAGEWLDNHSIHPERLMVLARLLRMAWLPSATWTVAARAALDYLEGNAAGSMDDYALNGLVARIDWLEKEDRSRWLALSCRWMKLVGSQRDCDSLLINCMKFFSGGVPLEIGDALDEAYKHRFPGKEFDWYRYMNLKS